MAVVTFLENTEDKEVLAKALVLPAMNTLEADSDALTGEIEDAGPICPRPLLSSWAQRMAGDLEGDAAALAEQLASLDAF